MFILILWNIIYKVFNNFTNAKDYLNIKIIYNYLVPASVAQR